MDFNPLDILAAAALGDKDASTDVKSTRSGQEGPSGSNNTTEESEDSKDADDQSEDNMGKITSNSLKSNVKKSDMAPSKSPWSPNAFLAESPVVSNKFSLTELVQDLKSNSECKKQLISDSIDDQNRQNELKDNQANGLNNVISVKNASNLSLDVLSEISPDSPSIKDIDSDCHLRHPEVTTDTSEQGSPSDTDTADSDSKSSEPADNFIFDSVGLDHSYSLSPGHVGPSSVNDPFEDDDVDVCSQSSPLTEETEQRSRNLSLDCNYLKSGILEGTSASTLDLYNMSYERSKRPSSSSSMSSPTHDTYTKQGFPHQHREDLLHSPVHVGTPEMDSSPSPPKFGKFRIGTFASFSSSNLELEKYLTKSSDNGKKLNVGIPSDTTQGHSNMSSPSHHSSFHPLVQSPTLNWDRSEANSDVHDDSSDARTPHRLSPDFTEKVGEWSHPMFHDHDYCIKESSSKPPVEEAKSNTVKRKYTKRKSKDSVINHEKIMRAKYLKKELLKQDIFTSKKTTPTEVEFVPVDVQSLKSNPVGRPKKRPPFEKSEENDEIDPETGAKKMKITGKFQDQFVYSLPKSSRTTSRTRQAPSLPFLSDKIIVPAPKPGDILIPHLTDADLEAVRLRGRAALHPNQCPNEKLKPNNITSVPQVVVPSSSTETFSDADSHIVSTILSMENDIGSPATSQASDISNTADLNPNQPALTESLRALSGDSSITSEHVLDYLLNVVKYEENGELINNTNDFDTTTSSLFAPLSSDSIYSKVDHLGSSDEKSSLATTTTQSVNSNTDLSKNEPSIINASAPSSPISTQSNHSTETIQPSLKNKELDTNPLPDDLSSFISNSQDSSSSSTNVDGDSQNSLKGMFGTDLDSLGTHPTSVPRLTSIEKTLDYLGVKDDDIQMDNQEVFSSRNSVDSSCQDNYSEDDTPWIVTVTLYCNDIPAIMINNEPCIRLVDIHKQILPAKDTGILKKRCQLLKIPVQNCSDMQRYFLVQYGRAYNSKSSLIISKDQATELVTYYATPQPRVGRNEDAAPLQRSRSRGSDSGGTMSPVTVGGSCKKKNHVKGLKKSSQG